jgi:undecaprenyl pyrophosphate synthase
MNVIKIITCLFFIFSLGACGWASSSSNFEVIDENNTSQLETKPELKIKVKVVDNDAILFVDTNLIISKTNYGKEKKNGEGHIHVYVNNGKKQAITTFRYVLQEVKAGKNSVRVSLHNNDHTPYGVYEILEFELK